MKQCEYEVGIYRRKYGRMPNIVILIFILRIWKF
jgi:hypothetical protein